MAGILDVIVRDVDNIVEEYMKKKRYKTLVSTNGLTHTWHLCVPSRLKSTDIDEIVDGLNERYQNVTLTSTIRFEFHYFYKSPDKTYIVMCVTYS
jgi:hypothetical protein